MNKQIGVALVLITLVSLAIAIQAKVQLRAARAVVAEDLSGNLPPDAPATNAVAPAPVSADTDAERVQALQRQVAALQAERDKLQSDLAAAHLTLAEHAKNTARPAPPPAGTNLSRRASFEERMAQLKHDDPARFEEMQKQREEFRQRMQTQADERSEFLKKIDTAAMTDEQRANHEKLTQTVEQARVLMARMATLSPDDAAAARQQMAEAIGSVSDLYQQERRYLLEQTGRAMGYQKDMEVGQFADYIQQIYDQTTLPRGFGGRGNGRNGPGASGSPGAGAPAP